VAEPIFDPLRVIAELNALGVRYVLLGELAAAAPALPLSADRVELFVADDDANIDRLRLFLEALDAQQLEDTGDVHHAAFLTAAGRVDCVDAPAAGAFAEVRERANEVNFGHGVVARVSAPDRVVVVPRNTRALIGALRSASLSDTPAARRARHDDEDEYGAEPVDPTVRVTPFRRVWKVFEDIDTFMNDLNERPLRKPRDGDER
jgi:hypothetical protein